MADQDAKDAAKNYTEPPHGTSLRGVIPAINTVIIDDRLTHARTAQVYSHISSSKERLVTKRSDQTMLARIRAGHSLLFSAYRYRISGSGDPKCKRCNSGEDDDVEHWLVCDGTTEARMKNFGTIHVELSDLTRCPRKSIALAQITLFRGAERG